MPYIDPPAVGIESAECHSDANITWKESRMATASQVLEEFNTLDGEEKRQAANAIAASRPLPDPPASYVGPIWVIVVLAFCIVLVGGGILLYQLVQDDKSTEVIGPLVTGALGVLAGLLAPSPVTQKTQS
jgi:hypothetical protein